MSMGRKVTIAGIVVGIAGAWIGLLVAVGLGWVGGSDQPQPAEFVFKDVSFGPFLIVAPDKAPPAPAVAGTTDVADVSVLTASEYYFDLPAIYTRTAITGRATDGDLVEVVSDWIGSTGSHIHVEMMKVDPAALPIQVADTPVTSHLLVQHKMLNGRYAIIEGPSLCSTELTGGSVTVWMNGATLTLGSSEASTSDLQSILGSAAATSSLQ
jgi:hypothetical protein